MRESNPSPDSRPLVKARGASHPLPSEREKDVLGAPARVTTVFSFSQGRRWSATGVLPSRRGPDEGSLPPRATGANAPRTYDERYVWD
jgi:hypothetical protein